MEGVAFEILVADDPNVCSKVLEADGVVLGGSERSAWEDCGFNDQLLDLIALCKHNQIPFLGICFGAQLLGRALGGRVERHPDGIELGAMRIELTEAGKNHFLFHGLRKGHFKSIETHQDAVLYLPSGCSLLAYTEHTKTQAFAYGDLMFGVQFHPEMNGKDLKNLWEGWVQMGEIEAVPSAYRETIEGCECAEMPLILRNFVERVKVGVASLVE